MRLPTIAALALLALPLHAETREELLARAEATADALWTSEILPRQIARRETRKANNAPHALKGFRQLLWTHTAPPSHVPSQAGDSVPDRAGEGSRPTNENGTWASIDPTRAAQPWPFRVRLDVFGTNYLDGFRCVLQLEFDGTTYEKVYTYTVRKTYASEEATERTDGATETTETPWTPVDLSPAP